MKTSSQATAFFSVGQAASYLSVSASQIRLMVDRGVLEAFTLASGHRRISAKSVKAYANGTTADDLAGDGKEVVGYCRTSSISQAESLTRQTSRLSATISERENLPADSIRMLSECCSSFGERKVFNQLVLDIVGGKVRKIYVEHWNRISRTMALNKLIDFLCETYGVEIIALDKEENPDELANNLQELLDFVQVLSCRQAAQKSKLVTVKHLPAQTVKRIAELSNEGRNQRDIHAIITAEGHKTEKGEPISINKVRQYVLLNGKVKTAVGIDPAEQTSLSSLLSRWVAENIVPTEGSRLTMKEILPRYNEWATAQGKATQDARIIGKMLVKMLPSKRVEGYRYFLNVSLSAS